MKKVLYSIIILFFLSPSTANTSSNFEYWIAYPLINDHPQPDIIALINPITDDEIQIDVNSFYSESLQWTPDYQSLFYVAPTGLYRVEVASQSIARLTNNTNIAYYDISPDGNYIAYVSRKEGIELTIINDDGNQIATLQDDIALAPIRFSLDSTNLYYQIQGGLTQYYEITTHEIGEFIIVQEQLVSEALELFSVQDELAGFSDLLLIDFATDQATSINNTEFYEYEPHFVLNDYILFYGRADDISNSGMKIMSLEDEELIELNVGNLLGYDISPNGEAISYIVRDTTSTQLCILSLVTFQDVCIKNDVWFNGKPAWSA